MKGHGPINYWLDFYHTESSSLSTDISPASFARPGAQGTHSPLAVI